MIGRPVQVALGAWLVFCAGWIVGKLVVWWFR